MKTLFTAFASLLLVQGIIAADFQCHNCEYSKECEDEGDEVNCVKPGVNCIFTMNAENQMGKGCYADWEHKPELYGLMSIGITDTTKLSGCVDMTNKEDNKRAYQVCLCSGDKCNTDDSMNYDMVTSVGDEGDRRCYTCGDLAKGIACTKEELEKKRTRKCKKDARNCFVVAAEKTKGDKKIEQTYRGCMVDNSDETFVYGSISFEKKNFKGDYYICNKNKCNLDQNTWKASSVAGLTSSLVLLFVGLVSYQLFN